MGDDQLQLKEHSWWTGAQAEGQGWDPPGPSCVALDTEAPT